MKIINFKHIINMCTSIFLLRKLNTKKYKIFKCYETFDVNVIKDCPRRYKYKMPIKNTENIKSTFLKAFAKSFLIKVRTFCARK